MASAGMPKITEVASSCSDDVTAGRFHGLHAFGGVVSHAGENDADW